jgi:hypothetical protein
VAVNLLRACSMRRCGAAALPRWAWWRVLRFGTDGQVQQVLIHL